MKIADGVFMVGGSDLSAPGDAAVYLVDGGEEAALIDAGTGEGVEEIVANIRECGVDPNTVKHLILTHCHVDHSAGIPAMRERLGLKVTAHEKGAEILGRANDPRTAASWYGMKLPPIEIDSSFSSTEHRIALAGKMAVELVCLHLPGHSPDSTVVYLDRNGERVLFGQDVHGPLHPLLGSDERLYRAMLEKLLALEADILCEGHFGVYRPRARVERYIRSYLDK